MILKEKVLLALGVGRYFSTPYKYMDVAVGCRIEV